jgi:hypothetical protein
MKKSFLELSKILTGFEDLKEQPGEVYYAILSKILGNDFASLLSEYDKKVKGQKGQPEELVNVHLWSNPADKKICQTIIRVWYHALLTKGADGFDWIAPSEIYYEALIWKAIKAHPLGLSGGYFGYWRYAPEN